MKRLNIKVSDECHKALRRLICLEQVKDGGKHTQESMVERVVLEAVSKVYPPQTVVMNGYEYQLKEDGS